MFSPFHSRLPGVTLVVLLCGLLPSAAHGPYDHSARIIVHEKQLELNIVLGTEVSALLLRDFPDALLQRGPTGNYPLPTSSATQLGILEADGTALQPTSVSVHAEPLEFAFSLLYDRPAARRLSFKPRYLEISERLPAGALEMTDENGNRLGVATLSRNARTAELPLPLLAAVAETTEAAAPRAGSPVPQSQIEVVQPPTPPETRRRSALFPMAVGVIAAIALGMIAFAFVRSRNSRS